MAISDCKIPPHRHPPHDHFGDMADAKDATRRMARAMGALALFIESVDCANRGDFYGAIERMEGVKTHMGYDIIQNINPLTRDVAEMLEFLAHRGNIIKHATILQNAARRKQAVADAETLLGAPDVDAGDAD